MQEIVSANFQPQLNVLLEVHHDLGSTDEEEELEAKNAEERKAPKQEKRAPETWDQDCPRHRRLPWGRLPFGEL